MIIYEFCITCLPIPTLENQEHPTYSSQKSLATARKMHSLAIGPIRKGLATCYNRL